MAQVLFKGVPDFTQVHIEVEKVKREVASISATPMKMGAGNAAKELKEVSTAAEKAAVSTKKVTVANDLLGDSFGNIYKKMLVWQVMGTMVSKTLGAFRDALDMMKQVDDELVTVRKVTGATAAEMDALSEKAYKVASAYGEAADEYLSSVSAFTRAGYGDQAADLAELATKTKLVGDTNAETAQQFLLSVDAAYQYKGNIEALSKVLDGSNEIDNKYATSIQKIAEGLGTVAPIAAQAHVGIDELTAAIGTITAVTQRSGTEAARAFRALVLNIVGDTKTEIDEGVTWTTGEIAGLRDVIKIYAKDAYDAAQATGEVIDPMKAIGGLAQSMKDGLLTEQKLMEMVSDIGGKLRTSQLLALIQNWDMYESMLADYGNAIGSADKEVENALDSWTRKTNILKNSWSEFVSGIVDTSAIKGALDGIIWVVDKLNGLLKGDSDNELRRNAGVYTGNINTYRQEIKALNEEIENGGGAATETQTQRLEKLQNRLGETEEKAKKLYETLKAQDKAGVLSESMRGVMEGLEDLLGIVPEVETATENAEASTISYVQALISEKTQAGKTGSELYNLVQAEIAANNQNLNFSQQIAALRTLATQAGYAASAIAAVFGMDENSMSNQIRAAANGLMMAGKAKTSQDAMRMAKQNYMNALWGSLTNFYTPESSGSPSGGQPSGGKPSSGSTKSQTDKQLEAHKENVSLLKSELTLMEKQGKSVGEQVEKIKAIQNALHRQAEYMRSIGASQDEINALSAEWYDWQEKIAELQKSLLSELDSAVQKKLDEAKKNRDAELDAIQAQIDALKEKNEAEDTELAIEEKRAAITEKQNELLEKQKALLDARNERTVRTYNAKTNQWEWIADEKNVKNAEDALKSAQDALEKAKDDLADYNKKLDRDAEIAALEAKKKQINAHYDALENAWDRIMDSLNDPVREINDILKDIAENATPALREQILKNRDLFEALGIDLSMFGDRVEQTANRLVKVLANGSAPGGLGVGDRVVTGGGTYEITGVRPDGSYESTLVDKNQTTGNYNGEYDYGTPSPSRRIAKVRSNGSAPPGLSVGDWVVTAAGTYQITAVNPDGTYQSALIDQSMTTESYTGRYDVYDQGGWLNGTGGIKATDRPETVLPPSLTEKLLSPAADATFRKRMSELGFLYGATDRTPATAGGTVTNSNVTNNNGAHYHYRDIVLTEEQARGMSLYQLTKLSGNLGNYNNM
nr:MAG TPA: minor tail protein [Caudoviricetes sp.]